MFSIFVLFAVDEKLSASKLKQQASKAYRELERQKMHKLLNQYLLILDKVEVLFYGIASQNWLCC